MVGHVGVRIGAHKKTRLVNGVGLGHGWRVAGRGGFGDKETSFKHDLLPFLKKKRKKKLSACLDLLFLTRNSSFKLYGTI